LYYIVVYIIVHLNIHSILIKVVLIKVVLIRLWCWREKGELNCSDRIPRKVIPCREGRRICVTVSFSSGKTPLRVGGEFSLGSI
jgi:hypothetical protein